MTESANRITVYKLAPAKRPYYQLQWVDADGVRRTRSTKSKDLERVELMRADLEYELNHGVVRPDGAAPLTWREFRTRYEQDKLEALADHTKQLTRIAFEKLEAAAAMTTLAAVREPSIMAFRRAMEREQLQPRSVHNNLALLRTALRWAAAQKLVAAVPHFDMPRVKDAGPPRRLLHPEGYPLLRKKLAPPWKTFLDVGWYTGMRRNEIVFLSWGESDAAAWLDAKMGRITFPAAASKNRRNEWIPVHRKLTRILAALRGRGVGRVIPSLPGGDQDVSARFRDACAEAGYDLRPHDLRRSFGSRYALAIKPAELQRLMRHTSIATTMRYYVNVDRSLEAAIHRL